MMRWLLGATLFLFSAPGIAQQPTVFAAASLRDALGEIVERFDRGAATRTRVSYASSAALAQQIAHGAPADIFISADREWMDFAAARGMVKKGEAVDLLRNRLVLIAPARAAQSLKIDHGFALAAALGGARLAIAHPDSVPAGRYGKAALTSLGVWNSVSDRLARTDNVRATLALVARGEAPLGIVYATDAKVEPKVRVVDVFPERTHPPIVYPAALIADSRVPAARNLFEYLGGADARGIWQKHGFTMAR